MLARTQPFYSKYSNPLEEQILASIKNETCFGLVECDIRVPRLCKTKVFIECKFSLIYSRTYKLGWKTFGII
jgi:hypothetical protein